MPIRAGERPAGGSCAAPQPSLAWLIWSDQGATVLAHSESKTLCVLRLVCKALRDGVDRLVVAVTFKPSDDAPIEERLARLARLPSLHSVTSGCNINAVAAIASVASRLQTLKFSDLSASPDQLWPLRPVAWPVLATLDIDVHDMGEETLRNVLYPNGGLPALRKLRLKTAALATTGGVKALSDAQLPALESLHLDTAANIDRQASTSLASGNWPSLRELVIGDNIYIRKQQLADMAAKARIRCGWPHLQALRLACSSFGGSTLSQLAQAFPHLKVLHLRNNALLQTPGAAVAAATFGCWTQIEELDLLNQCGPSDSAEAVLNGIVDAHWPHLARLAISCPGSGGLPPAAAGILARGAWPALRTLTLPETPIGDVGVALLARAQWPALEQLDLSGCNMTPRGLAALAGVPWRLRALRLTHNPRLGPDAAPHLASAAWARHLTSLELLGAGLGAQGLVALRGFPRLRCLSMPLNKMEDAPCAAALAGQQWAGVTRLDFSCNALGPLSAAALTKLAMPALQYLEVEANALGGRGLAALVAGGNWPDLRMLSLASPLKTEGDSSKMERFDTKSLLNLVNGCWPQLECVTGVYYPCLNRTVDAIEVADLLKARWPDLFIV